MSVNKTPNGRWRARVKYKGQVKASGTFDLKRDAEAFEAQEIRKMRLDDSVDLKAGLEPVRSVRDRWLKQRAGTVASKTFEMDKSWLTNHLPPTLSNSPIRAVRPADIDSLYGKLLKAKMARSSVVRFRGVLSAFFSWAVREGLIGNNPVVASVVPKGLGQDQTDEIYPFSLEELREVLAELRAVDPARAEIAHVLALTGIRWGELAALRVRDVARVPAWSLMIPQRAPDGHPVRSTTKGGRGRTVPIPSELVPIIESRMMGKKMDDLLFTSPLGARLNGPNWKLGVKWSEKSRGRRVHDLRHTSATLWLAGGLDLKTVQTWLGHSSARLTADTYAHWLGSDADRAALTRFEAILGDAPGTRNAMRSADSS